MKLLCSRVVLVHASLLLFVRQARIILIEHQDACGVMIRLAAQHWGPATFIRNPTILITKAEEANSSLHRCRTMNPQTRNPTR